VADFQFRRRPATVGAVGGVVNTETIPHELEALTVCLLKVP